MKKGITLISLVITIIIMIILATVAINLAVDGNGLFRRAGEAANDWNESVAQEGSTIDNLMQIANTLGGTTPEDEGGEGEIFAEQVDSNNYGDYVEYPIDLDGDGNIIDDWRIFYSDGTHIFLIAADYVRSDSSYLDLAAAEMYGYADYNSSYPYSVNWYNQATSSSTLSTHTGNNYINSNVASLFMYNKYYTAYPNATNINAKATASLLDTEAWKKLKDNKGYADYAIGGPTLEMWVASYNELDSTPLYTNKNSTGYYVGTSEGTTSNGAGTSLYYHRDVDYDDTLYYPHKSNYENCWGYWLASPSAYNAGGVMGVDYSGYVYCDYCDDDDLRGASGSFSKF